MEPDTTKWEDVPVAESPTSYEVVRPRYFGLTPRGVVVAIAAVALVAALVALASGQVAVGLLLLVAAGLLAALYLEQARRRRESSLDRVAAAAVDNTRALAGFTGASVRAWTGAGREVARLRLEANRLARERSQLQYALGGAAFDEDAHRIGELRAELKRCVDRIAECASEAHAVIEGARNRTSRERLAVAQTQIREPQDLQSQ
jgi:hypothetical protein